MAMRTTVRLNPTLMAKAKKEAARRGQTLTSLIESGLRLVLAEAPKKFQKSPVKLPVSRARGGTWPGIDLSNSAAVLDAMGETD